MNVGIPFLIVAVPILLFLSVEQGRGFAKSASHRHLHKVIQFENLNLFHRLSLGSDTYKSCVDIQAKAYKRVGGN
ncbi:hypothetical protein [Peribacillus loiseleuriae]|uniref:hypothetical protein n=1 Tax=Peribacillus loiseleuriae TaxID=1679170 RepID=UPI003CFECFBA